MDLVEERPCRSATLHIVLNELRRAARSRVLWVLLGVACLLVVASAVQDGTAYANVLQAAQAYGNDTNYGQQQLAVNSWVGADMRGSSDLLYLLLPLITILPHCWHLGQDMRDGYAAHEIARVGRRTWLQARLVASFVLSAGIAASIVLLSVALSLCVAPMQLPGVREYINLGWVIVPNNLLSTLFFTAPLGYELAWVVLTACVYGFWGACASALSCRIANRVVLIVGLWFSQLVMSNVEDAIANIIGLSGPLGFDVLSVTRPYGISTSASVLGIVLYLSVTGCIIWLAARKAGEVV